MFSKHHHHFMAFGMHPHHGFFGGHRRGGPGRGGPFGRGPGGRFERGFGDFSEAPPRADRGGVRYLVLDALVERPRHGYEIIQAIEQRSGGAYRPSPGTIYPTLQMLEELGQVRTVDSEGSRKAYEITEEGKRELSEHRNEVDDFYERSAPRHDEQAFAAFAELKERAFYLVKSFRRAAFHGRLTSETATQIVDVANKALDDIERILRASRK